MTVKKMLKMIKYNYVLEVKEPYIIKTELTKNRTHQTYRWKQLAIGLSKEDLIPLMTGPNKNNMRIVEL